MILNCDILTLKMRELSKYILNHLLHNGVLKYKQSLDLVTQISEKLEVENKNIKQILTDINDNIAKHQFRIDVRTCEISGEKIIVFVNKSNDDLSATTSVSPVELELLELILHEIFMSASKCISSMLCLNLTNRLRGNISKDLAQTKLETWNEIGYLVHDCGMVYLGARAISEFEKYFESQFKQRMTKCKLCTDYVYFGKICASCTEVFHKHCVSKHLSRTKRCPLCKKDWVEAEGRNYDDDDDDEESEINGTTDSDSD